MHTINTKKNENWKHIIHAFLAVFLTPCCDTLTSILCSAMYLPASLGERISLSAISTVLMKVSLLKYTYHITTDSDSSLTEETLVRTVQGLRIKIKDKE